MRVDSNDVAGELAQRRADDLTLDGVKVLQGSTREASMVAASWGAHAAICSQSPGRLPALVPADEGAVTALIQITHSLVETLSRTRRTLPAIPGYPAISGGERRVTRTVLDTGGDA